MKYTNHTVAGSLRVNYERYLYPYERFLIKTGKLELKRSLSQDSQPEVPLRLATPSPVKSETSTPTKCKYGLRQNRRRPSHLEVLYSLSTCMSVHVTKVWRIRTLSFTTNPKPRDIVPCLFM